MNILFFLIPIALMLAGLAVWGFLWAARSGQFEDVETPALRILMDDERNTPNDAVSSTNA